MWARMGELCYVEQDGQAPLLAEVVGFEHDAAQLMTFEDASSLRPGAAVTCLGHGHRIPEGDGLLGRVMNGLGQPIDGLGPLDTRRWRSPARETTSSLDRPRITQPFITGIRVIDGLLTCGRGQRVGLFAGSGVGKSTLLGEIAREGEADVNVIVLVGERGREVRPFVEDCLGAEGLNRSVVIVATSDEAALMRLRAVTTAVSIARQFRDSGRNVLFLLDSLTRMAFAQREIGLLRGEPPGARGFTPSVLQVLASTLEQLASTDRARITSFITILVEGNDFDEPIADWARGILDGHIVLSRQLAARGQYPAVDVLQSLSRLFPEVTAADQQLTAARLRNILATHAEAADLIDIGAYKPGSSARLDQAITLLPAILHFLKQDCGAASSFIQTQQALEQVTRSWID